jgi:NAD(P)-dependent dehydrogenase (short-subunit alcohol dehydrogenase family)
VSAEGSAADGVLRSFRLDGRVALVTGASSGLGVAFAEALVQAGAAVAIGARRVERLAETQRRLEAIGGRVLRSACDVTDPHQCDRFVAQAVEHFGRVDILVNNAGIGAAVPATRETPEHFRSLVQTNLEGAYWCAQAFARTARPGAVIINVASTLGLRPVPMPQAGYVASKAALIGLTRDLALQWTGRKGIRVNALAPGFFPSEMSDRVEDAERAMVEAATPFGRFGRTEELTPALVFLASDASAYMTGTTLAVDGGLSMH